MLGAYAFEQLHAGNVRHALVGHDDVDFVLLHEPGAFRAVSSLEHAELVTQEIMNGITDVRFIVHDQKTMLLRFAHAAPRGTSKKNGKRSVILKAPGPYCHGLLGV